MQITSRPAGRGASLRTTVRAGAPDAVHAIGLRLVDLGADRLLIDGYQSWDWAGLRSGLVPGAGWWGAIAGAPGLAPLSIRLDQPPRAGALQISWSGGGTLDVASTGEPVDLGTRTGEPTRLADGVLQSDWIRLAPLAHTTVAGAGLPTPPAGGHRPGRRRTGWMSWNCLGSSVVAADLVRAARHVPAGEVLLLDDGWMQRWGDWVEHSGFGDSLRGVADVVHRTGHTLGVWLAPFLVDPESRVAAEHPDWLLRNPDSGEAFVDHRTGAARYVIDASRAPARRHLRGLGEAMGRTGVGVLKLDFLYAGASPAALGAARSRRTGVRALRDGVSALTAGFRATAQRDAAVWACGAPMAPLVGLVDAGRSGGDAVMAIPTAHTPQPPPPHFVHGPVVLKAQARNLAARAWLWGGTVPPDVDAVTLGQIRTTPPVDDATAASWLRLAQISGGPMLNSDTSVPLERLDALRCAQTRALTSPPRPIHTADPLAGDPAPPEDDDFLSQPGDIGSWP